MKFLRKALRKKWTARLIAFYLKTVYKTSSWTFENEYIFEEIKNFPRIFCFWHGRLAMMPFAWKQDQTFYMLLSKHGDGQFIANILLNCGNFDVINGSTNRGGMEAIRGILRHLKDNHPIGITPDGPRGPRETVSEGTAFLAYASKALVIPVSFSISRCIFLKSWDRFCFPFPFSKGKFVLGTPVHPPESKEEFSTWCDNLSQKISFLDS